MVQLDEPALFEAIRAVRSALSPRQWSSQETTNIGHYVVALARFGAHTDLVGARTTEALVELALADALVLTRRAELLQPPVWEIGAGGASLSVPLAILSSAFTGTLFEPRQKRATFLRMAIGSRGLGSRVAVEQARIDPKAPPTAAAGCALCRAVFPPAVWIPMAARMVRSAGTIGVLATERPAIPAGIRTLSVDEYVLPFSGSRRVVLWLSVE